jgi:hypothetical protein
VPGRLVEYARFVEVRQRRARIVAALEPPPATLASSTALERFIGVGESTSAVDGSATQGTGDGR